MNKPVDPALMQAAEAVGSAPPMAAYWMPFTANRQFKAAPRLLQRAEGMHYWDVDGRQVLDGVAGLWCVNAGHGRPRITQAIQAQAAEMDFAPPFQMAHPKAFELAERIAAIAPPGMDRVFFANSGSEAVDTALKMALAYHRMRGDAARTRLIGRERGYHGVNFGGISVGGMVANRKYYGQMLGGVDHIRHTHDAMRNAFSVGQPAHGAELADDLERLVALHDASTIAAVIVEPIAGSTGVLIPPQGYLQRLREICTKHGILLIFDEVITGFGRTGQPFAAQTFGDTPRPHGLRQGPDQWRGADGRGDRRPPRARRVHGARCAGHRVFPRLHLFGASAGLRGGHCHAGHLCRRRLADARCDDGRALRRGIAFAAG